MATKSTPADEAGTIERIHRSSQKLMDDNDSLRSELVLEAKKKAPSAARLKALSDAIETLQSSLLRQNMVVQRFKDGLHPKTAPLMSNDTHQTTEIKAPGLIFAQFPKGAFDAVRQLVDEAQKSGTGFATSGGIKPGRNRVNP